MLGLEVLLAVRSFEYSELADQYLQEVMDTCVPLQWKTRNGWIVATEQCVPFGRKWKKYWRIWGANYPYGWLNVIAWSDWGYLNEKNFNELPWVNIVKQKMPSRKMSWKFWWWLKRNGIKMDFSSNHPLMTPNGEG